MKAAATLPLWGLSLILFAGAPATAQQTTGSPDATLSIEGNKLPPVPPKFGGVVKERATESKPWWPPRVVPPKGAPNVFS